MIKCTLEAVCDYPECPIKVESSTFTTLKDALGQPLLPPGWKALTEGGVEKVYCTWHDITVATRLRRCKNCRDVAELKGMTTWAGEITSLEGTEHLVESTGSRTAICGRKIL